MRSSHEKDGFTVIEMVVVIGALGILSSIAVPNIIGFVDEARYQAAKSQLLICKKKCDYNPSHSPDLPGIPGVVMSGVANCADTAVAQIGGNCCISLGLSDGSRNGGNGWGHNFKDCTNNCSTSSFVATNNEESGKEKDIGNKCNYVSLGSDNASLNKAKWMYAMCEESFAGVELCQHPYVYANPEHGSPSGPPFPLVACSSLCGTVLNEATDPRCGSGAYRQPEWLKGADDWSVNAHTDGAQGNYAELLEEFKSGGWLKD